MPQLTFTGVPLPKLNGMCAELHKNVAEASGARKEDVKFEWIPSVRLGMEGVCGDYPKIEVLWLGRPQEVQDNTAKVITELFHQNGFPFVQVTFTNMPASDFYENGQHY